MTTTQLGRALSFLACAAITSSLLHAQGRGGVEWTTGGYDAQRTASIKNDSRISVQTMQKPGEFGAFKFLWKLKLEYEPKAATALTQPILLDRIIGFRGFKSIAFVGTQSETVHAIDIDMGAPLWKYHINYSASPPPMLNVTNNCPGGLVAPLSRPTAIAPAAAAAAVVVAGSAVVDDPAAVSVNRAKAPSLWRLPANSAVVAQVDQADARARRVPLQDPQRQPQGMRREVFLLLRAVRVAAVDSAAVRSCPATMPRTSSAATDSFMR